MIAGLTLVSYLPEENAIRLDLKNGMWVLDFRTHVKSTRNHLTDITNDGDDNSYS